MNVMENVFVKYLSKKAKKEELKVFEAGPVITISRQYGCYATKIANFLVVLLNKKSPNPWDVITKEVLTESAKRLEVNPHNIAHIFGADEKSFLSDIMISFSTKTYTSDNVIINTIRSVVEHYAKQGNCIIVGRAGCIISKDIKKAIHIRLTASYDYRVNSIKTRFSLSKKEAQKKVLETDKKRETFMSFFKKTKKYQEVFDLTLNVERLSKDEIAEIIAVLAEKRNLV